jgi:hypothetical protein
MRRAAFVVLGLAAGLTGCVERRFVVESDPPGALVMLNGQPLGVTPCDAYYVYHGAYDLTLIKDGYQTLQVKQEIPAKFYEYPVIDFVSENLYPGKIEDRRQFRYTLQPMSQPRADQLLQQATQLRERGKAIPSTEVQGPQP